MNTSLTRKNLLERAFDPADIHNLAAMLSGWQRRPGEFGHAVVVEARLWGFPIPEGPALRDRIAARAYRRDLPTLTVSLLDPNILSLRSDRLQVPPQPTLVMREAVQAAPLNAWDMGNFGSAGSDTVSLEASPVAAVVRSVIEDESFDYLLCEFRLTFPNRGSEHTVVLSGTLRHGRYRLRGIWPVGRAEFTEDAYIHAVWPQERDLLQALDKYVSTGQSAIPEWARLHLFRSETGKAVGGPLSWYLQPPNKGPAQFLLRLGIALLTIVVCFLLQDRVAPSMPLLTPLIRFVEVAAGLAFLFTAGMKAFMVYMSYTLMKKTMRQIYSTRISHPEVDLTRTMGSLEDPAVRKLTAEVEAAGGRHFKDIGCDPPLKSGQAYNRVFLFPEDDTVFILLLMHKAGEMPVYPARPSFLLGTRFTDGFQLSTSSSGTGWSKKLMKHVISRQFLGVTDPVEMIQKHREMLRAAEADGHVRKPLVPAEVVAGLENDHNELCEAKAKYGYFRLSDAFHMVFDITRREYRV